MIKLAICFFIVVLSVANSAVRANPSLPIESFCSMNGTGVANVTGLGENIPFVMKRVRNFVRYDFYGSDQEVAASVLVRPDLGNTYFDVGSSCASMGRPLSLSYYEYSEASKDSTTFALGTSANITLNKESIPISEHFTGLPGDVNIDVQYTSVDYEYFFNGDYFVLKNCAGAESNSSDARTSVQCGINIHDELCSFHGVGTSVVEGVQELFTTEVYRVSGYSRYDLYNNTPDGPVLYASLVERPDLNTSFMFNASLGGSCYSHRFKSLSHYFYKETINGLDIFMGNGKEKQKILVGHEDKNIVMEVIPFRNNETGVDLAVTITYESVDFDYEHNEEDGLFSLTNSFCPEAATNATEAITSDRCNHLLVPKYPRCSFDFTVTSPTDPDMVVYYRYHVDNSDYGYFESISNGQIAFLRCDIRDMLGGCLAVWFSGTDKCVEEYGPFETVLFDLFEYHGDPVDVECPDKSTGCKKYSYSDKSYIIVDKEGRYVVQDDVIFTYYTDRLSLLDNLTFQRCDGTRLEPPDYRCDDLPSSSSSITDSQGDATDWWVEIEFKERVLATEVNATAVLESIGVECGLEMSEMGVRIETDENGYVNRIIVYVKDEATALSICETLNGMDEGAKCEYEVLCRVKSVRVHLPFHVVSGSCCLEVLFSFVCLLVVILSIGNRH